MVTPQIHVCGITYLCMNRQWGWWRLLYTYLSLRPRRHIHLILHKPAAEPNPKPEPKPKPRPESESEPKPVRRPNMNPNRSPTAPRMCGRAQVSQAHQHCQLALLLPRIGSASRRCMVIQSRHSGRGIEGVLQSHSETNSARVCIMLIRGAGIVFVLC